MMSSLSRVMFSVLSAILSAHKRNLLFLMSKNIEAIFVKDSKVVATSADKLNECELYSASEQSRHEARKLSDTQ
jgi:hypothetical protein